MIRGAMTKGWAAIALAVIAAIVIGAGLVLTGGPAEARKERRDRERDSDLTALTELVDCLARTKSGSAARPAGTDIAMRLAGEPGRSLYRRALSL